MKIEKRLIAYSTIALIIGVAAVMPLLFSISAQAEIPPDQKPQFSINIPYIYISNYWNESIDLDPIEQNAEDTPALSFIQMMYALVFNATLNFDPEAVSSDAVVEYYLLEIQSDKGHIGNVTFSIGVNLNDLESNQLPWFHFSRDQWFDTNSSEDADLAGRAYAWVNVPYTYMGLKKGSGSDWNRSLGEPETIVINVRRQGWVVLNDNSTVAYLASPEPILQIQLVKYGNGFLYNIIIPEDELAQIDPLMPQLKLAR